MIQTWFPKTLFVRENVLNDKLLFYENFIESKFKEHGSDRHGIHYVESSHASFDQFHTLPEMEDLVREICISSQEYLQAIGYNNNTISKLKIKNMWCNISKNGDYLYPHIHGESLLSGAFYVCCGSEDKIKFFNDISNTFLKPPDFFNEYNYQYCEYPCTPGSLLIFKSNFLHGTEAQKSDKKIVVSFNISE
jgi:uncharacterized protein (TIGR02466 family)